MVHRNSISKTTVGLPSYLLGVSINKASFNSGDASNYTNTGGLDICQNNNEKFMDCVTDTRLMTKRRSKRRPPRWSGQESLIYSHIQENHKLNYGMPHRFSICTQRICNFRGRRHSLLSVLTVKSLSVIVPISRGNHKDLLVTQEEATMITTLRVSVRWYLMIWGKLRWVTKCSLRGE